MYIKISLLLLILLIGCGDIEAMRAENTCSRHEGLKSYKEIKGQVEIICKDTTTFEFDR